MRRKQLYLDDDLDRDLKVLARRSGKSEAEHVRAALRAYLVSYEQAPASDPLADLVGMVDDGDGPDDVAEQHDRYLYGARRA